MKKILVTGAGGTPATNFIRSLRDMKEKVLIVGTDNNEYYFHRSEADINYLVPGCSDSSYIDFLNHIIKKHSIEFVHVQNDAEVAVISTHREKLAAKTFLPSKDTVTTCLDKYQSYQLWEKAGLPLPRTFLISNEEDMKTAYEKLGGKVWLRAIEGAGGKGALVPQSLKQAVVWIESNNGWGRFTAATLLTPNSVTWMSVWDKGALIVAQTRKRLYWELARTAPAGITGITGAGETYSNKTVDDTAMKAIQAIDSTPHGIFSVDLTYDTSGTPNPTEINIGRFFTTHYFFTKAGLNMPEIYLKLAYGEQLPAMPKKINPLPDGLVWIRGVDFLPVLTTRDKVQEEIEKMTSMKKELS